MALLANGQLFLITRAARGAKNFKDFIAHAKVNPDKMGYGSAGNGTTPHLAGGLLKQSAGITATHVPYRGAALVIQEVMAGQIDCGLRARHGLPHRLRGLRPAHQGALRVQAYRGPDGPRRLHARAGRGNSDARPPSGLADPAGLNRPA